MSSFVFENFKKFVDVAFDEHLTCNLCGEEVFHREDFCAECLSKLVFIGGDRCERCGRAELKPVEACRSCKASFVDLSRSVFKYGKESSLLIQKLKYGGAAYLARILAKYLFRAYTENYFSPDVVTFVPMTDKEHFKRGYNHSEKLCEELCKLVGAQPFPLFVKKFDTLNQVGLDFEERQKNLKGSFSLVDGVDVKGKKVLIVDDVLTTGATSSELARLLKSKKAKTVYLITVASVVSPSVAAAERARNERAENDE